LKVLVKIGGTLLDEQESRRRLAAEIAAVVRAGVRIVVVHGGGKQMTRFLAERGIESRFVNGLRVTTSEVLDAVLKVLAGSVNQELVSALVAEAANAVGLTGMDALLTEAEQTSQELGFVGHPVASDAALLELLVSNGYLPVVACVAGDRQGNFYNVNADQMAVACAKSFQVSKLIFLTDVEGVRGRSGEIASKLTSGECRALIDEQIATGGMRAKLEAAMNGLEQGVGEVVIAPGAQPGIVRRLISGGAAGTRLIAEMQLSGNV